MFFKDIDVLQVQFLRSNSISSSLFVRGALLFCMLFCVVPLNLTLTVLSESFFLEHLFETTVIQWKR